MLSKTSGRRRQGAPAVNSCACPKQTGAPWRRSSARSRYSFRDRRLLVRALTHSSFANDDPGRRGQRDARVPRRQHPELPRLRAPFRRVPAGGEKERFRRRGPSSSRRTTSRTWRAASIWAPPCACRRERNAQAAANATRASRTLSRRSSPPSSSTRASTRPAPSHAGSSGPTSRRSTSAACTAATRRRRSRSVRRARACRCRSTGSSRSPARPHDRRFIYEVTYGERERATGEGTSKKEAQTAAAEAMLRKRDEKKESP